MAAGPVGRWHDCWAYLVLTAPNPVVHAVWKEFWVGLVLLCHWKAPGAAALIAVYACVCVLVGCSVKAYLFHQLWAGSAIAVCLLLMRRLSDRFSSIVCLQFSETAPVGKAVWSHHSLKGEKKSTDSWNFSGDVAGKRWPSPPLCSPLWQMFTNVLWCKHSACSCLKYIYVRKVIRRCHLASLQAVFWLVTFS